MALRRALLHACASLVRHPARPRLTHAPTPAAPAAAAAARSLTWAASRQRGGRGELGRGGEHLVRGAPPEPELRRRRASLERPRALERRRAPVAPQLALRKLASLVWAEDAELCKSQAQRILGPLSVQRVGPPVAARFRRCGLAVSVGLRYRPANVERARGE